MIKTFSEYIPIWLEGEWVSRVEDDGIGFNLRTRLP